MPPRCASHASGDRAIQRQDTGYGGDSRAAATAAAHVSHILQGIRSAGASRRPVPTRHAHVGGDDQVDVLAAENGDSAATPAVIVIARRGASPAAARHVGRHDVIGTGGLGSGAAGAGAMGGIGARAGLAIGSDRVQSAAVAALSGRIGRPEVLAKASGATASLAGGRNGGSRQGHAHVQGKHKACGVSQAV